MVGGGEPPFKKGDVLVTVRNPANLGILLPLGLRCSVKNIYKSLADQEWFVTVDWDTPSRLNSRILSHPWRTDRFELGNRMRTW